MSADRRRSAHRDVIQCWELLIPRPCLRAGVKSADGLADHLRYCLLSMAWSRHVRRRTSRKPIALISGFAVMIQAADTVPFLACSSETNCSAPHPC